MADPTTNRPTEPRIGGLPTVSDVVAQATKLRAEVKALNLAINTSTNRTAAKAAYIAKRKELADIIDTCRLAGVKI